MTPQGKKILGIIAEYNPFHNGHLYHLEEAKRLSGCDHVVIVMSGDFVQRGEPAILDKYTRTRFALEAGADIVFELPTALSCGSAEYFARGAVGLLQCLGVVDAISFGCETPDITALSEIAEILEQEPDSYRERLQGLLRSGLSYPLARQQALEAYLLSEDYVPTANAPSKDVLTETQKNAQELSALLSSPNNILAIEYLKALSFFQSNMELVPILRKGEYHATQLQDDVFASASAIRSILQNNKSQDHSVLAKHVPSFVYQTFTAPDFSPVKPEDFSDIIYYAIQRAYGSDPDSEPTSYQDVSKELANRLADVLHEPWDYSFVTERKLCKGYTATRLYRALLHILLNITEKDMQDLAKLSFTPYAHLLGFRRESSSLLRKVTDVPLITKIADAPKLLSEQSMHFLRQDIFAAELYNQVVFHRYGKKIESDYYHKIQILD